MDPRFPAAGEVAIGDLLERRVSDRPDDTFAVFRDGSSWSYRQTAEEAWGTAELLSSLGVGRGDFVISWLPNGPDALRVWFGANAIGAVYAPINPAYRGAILEHAIDLAGASVMVAHAGLLERLESVDLGRLTTVLTVGGDARPLSGVSIGRFSPTPQPNPPAAGTPPAPWDPTALILTSGTTGPSKAVLCPAMHHYTVGSTLLAELGADDRFFVYLPLFHIGGTSAVYWMLQRGGSVAVVDGFRTEIFWDEVRELQVTFAYIVGAMASFLLAQPERADDADHPLRLASCIPMVEDPAAFSNRFGIDVFNAYGMTEVSCPLRTPLNPSDPATCGRPTGPEWQLRLVDDNDVEVPVGEPGELIVRHDRPWSMNAGYKDDAGATAAAWRNGWFHTGDILRRDEAGDYFFVDRKTHSLRRRGENISSMEVEREILTHPDVLEAAVIGVPSAHLEDDVKAVVAPHPGGQVDPAGLIEHLRRRLPHFMVPRYVEVVDSLPKTDTQRVRKHLLDRTVNERTWDREAAGIRIRSERLEDDRAD